MRGVLLVIVQLVISLLVVGAVMPAVLLGVSSTRGPRVGLVVTGTIAVVVFVMIRLAWPRRRQSEGRVRKTR
jgi:hypothetical protein